MGQDGVLYALLDSFYDSLKIRFILFLCLGEGKDHWIATFTFGCMGWVSACLSLMKIWVGKLGENKDLKRKHSTHPFQNQSPKPWRNQKNPERAVGCLSGVPKKNNLSWPYLTEILFSSTFWDIGILFTDGSRKSWVVSEHFYVP